MTRILDDVTSRGSADLAVDVAARLPLEILADTLGLPRAERGWWAERYLRLLRGVGWHAETRSLAHTAAKELGEFFERLLVERRATPGDDLLSTLATMSIDGDLRATGRDVVATLLERDHETMHGLLANLWCLLLTHPDQLATVQADRRLVTAAYLEAVRHSTPVLSGIKYTTREVERWGRLLPEGATVVCSAAAANRDPRVFADPDAFNMQRRDLCQREPRGQFRADGLPAGIAIGVGNPSTYPALPPDRPRSWYAVTRDTVTTATNLLLDRLGHLRLTPDVTPTMRSLRVGEARMCWHLPVEFD